MEVDGIGGCYCNILETEGGEWVKCFDMCGGVFRNTQKSIEGSEHGCPQHHFIVERDGRVPQVSAQCCEQWRGDGDTRGLFKSGALGPFYPPQEAVKTGEGVYV